MILKAVWFVQRRLPSRKKGFQFEWKTVKKLEVVTLLIIALYNALNCSFPEDFSILRRGTSERRNGEDGALSLLHHAHAADADLR